MSQRFTKKQIADLLKDMRLEKDLKGPEVVRLLKQRFDIELSDKTLYGYENGVSSPNIPTFLALCDIYEIEDVLGALEKTKPHRRTLSPTEERLIKYFKAASPELQEAALRMLQPVEKENTASKVG